MCLACIGLMCAGHRQLAARPLMEHNGRPAHCAQTESRGVSIFLEFPMKFTAGVLRKQLAALPPVNFFNSMWKFGASTRSFLCLLCGHKLALIICTLNCL